MGRNTAQGTLKRTTGRLSKPDRRQQLLDAALAVLRKDGADRLTLGRLAERAGVSKPVVYDHFGTRSGLLVALYKSIDAEQVSALRAALSARERSLDETARVLAAAYIRCGADTNGDWQALGAALAGSGEMDAVHRELLDGYVLMFSSALQPHSTLSAAELERRCVGLIGAGEALIAAMLRGRCSEHDAAETFASLIGSGLRGEPQQP